MRTIDWFATAQRATVQVMKPPKSVSEIVRAYFAAYESKDKKAVEELLSEDFTFTSPLDDHIDRATYFARCWPNSATMRALRIEKLFEEGNEAFVRYELETNDGVRFRNTEHIQIDRGQIKDIVVFFGPATNHGKDHDAVEIRALLESRAEGARAKDAERAMAGSAADILSFDVVNPLQNMGSDASRERVEQWFASFDGPRLGYEMRELSITAGRDVAFSRNLNHVTATKKDGQKLDMWWRRTACFHKIDGKWTITHTHDSVPFDTESGKASLELQP